MTDTTALATREYSDRQLQQRIRLNQQAGYGLDNASPAQLNIVFLMCQRYDLDPVSDITLFEGRPFITIDGRFRLLRRHPEYRGYASRPLSKDEKEAWGFEPSDIVVECTIRTTTWGDISARGRVAASEVEGARERARASGKRSAPIGTHPVEIAEKRAIARAERAAFGQEAVLDEEEVEQAARMVIEERKDPERIAAGAAEYDRVIGAHYEDDAVTVPHRAEADVSVEPSDAGTSDLAPERKVTSKTDPLWKTWLLAERDARAAGLEVDTSQVKLGISAASLEASTRDLLDAVRNGGYTADELLNAPAESLP